jgi:archaeosortase B (VPXXXP-CTERM-specific)
MEKKRTEKRKIKKTKSTLRAHKAIIKFCVIFFGLLIVLTTTFPFLSDKFNPQLSWLMAVTADLTGLVLRLFGLTVTISGRVVSLSNFSMEVVGECTGLYEMLIFLAAMIAYPSSYKKKLIGAALGLPLLYVINIIRMIFIAVVGNWSPQTFNFMHLYFWQVAMILIIVSVWILWIEKIVYYERKREELWVFIAEFLLVSLPLFILWYWKGLDLYISILDDSLYFFFHTLLGVNSEFSFPKDIFNNLIPFVALMLITRGMKFKKRASKLGWGVLILILGHVILSKLVYFLNPEPGVVSKLYEKLSVPLYLFSETLPFLLWILLARKQVVDLFIPRKVEVK